MMLNNKYFLTKDNKLAWEKVTQSDLTVPIFMHGIWLDAVCDSWTVYTAEDYKNEIVGAIVFHYKSKYTLPVILNPNMTPYHGLWIKESTYFQAKNKNTVNKKISNLLISALPDFIYCNLRLPPSIVDTQIFKWKGYNAKVRYTYIIHKPESLEKAWNNLDHKKRNSIIKAQKDLIFECYNDINKHYEIVQETFLKAKESNHVDLITYTKMYLNLQKQSRSFLFCVKDNDNKIHSSLLLVRDANSAYLISHGTITNAHRGATSLLIWKSIEFAFEHNIKLDFEGSDIERIEAFYRDFGGEITPYYQVVKSKNKFWKMILTLIGKM